MPGKKYTVQDTQSGKTVTFEWNQPNDPTDSDFEEVFSSAGLRQSEQLSPQVEAIRQKNLKSGLEQAGGRFTRSLQSADIQPDVQQMRSLNPFAAAAGGVQAARKILGSPLTLAGAAVPPLGWTINKIGEGIGSAVEWNAAQQGLTPEVRKALLLKLGVAQNPQQAQAINEAGTGLTTDAAAILAGGALPMLRKPVGGTIENAASRMAGKAFGAGENFMRTEQLGKFAQESGLTLGKAGLAKAQQIANQLNSEIQTKIIQPATDAGVKIDGAKYVQAMKEFKAELENRAVPDRASIFAVDRMIKASEERLSRLPEGLDPKTAQEMKVTNNKILQDVYKKLEAGGNITERGVAKKAALIEQTDVLRKQLEDIHPELRNVNWHEGQALQLKDAIFDYLNRRAKGEGGTGVVARGGIGKVATVSIYDLLKLRAIGSRVAVLLGKTGRAISGNKPDIVRGVQNPFKAK